MNDGMYQAFRNYLEEHSSQNKEIIGLLERQNELLNEIRLAANRTDDRLKELAKETVYASLAETEAVLGDTLEKMTPKPAAKKGK